MSEVESPTLDADSRRPFIGHYYAGRIGRRIIDALATLQGLGAFALITLTVMPRKFGVATRVIRPLIEREIFRVGIQLLPMVLFAALALGFLVIGQTVAVLTRVGAANELLGNIMVIVVVRELGPLLMAFLVLGRVGTANVVELGMARALGEVESLEAVGVDPVHYLVVPRVVGMVVGTFSLTVYLILGALGSGYLWAFVQEVPIQPADYFSQLAGALTALDFVMLALKTGSFGFIIAIVTCYYGLAHPLQLDQISRATVRAVSQSVVACVLLDTLFIIAYLTL